MNVVVNRQSAEARDIKANDSQYSILGRILFQIYINYRHKSILQYFKNIYADNTTLYWRNFKILDEQSLARNLSLEHRFSNSMRRKFVTQIQYIRSKTTDVHSSSGIT